MARVALGLSFVALAVASLGTQARKSVEDVAAELMRRYADAPDIAIGAVVQERLDVRALIVTLRKDTAQPPRLRAALALELAFVAIRDDMQPTPLRNPLAESLAPQDASRNRPKPVVFVDAFNLAFDLASSIGNDAAFSKAWDEVALSMLEGGSEVLPTAIAGHGGSPHLLDTFLDRSRDAFEQGRWHLARASVHERLIAEIVDYEWPTYKGLHQPSGNTVGAQIEGNLTRARTAALAELEKAREDEAFRALAEIHIAEVLRERNKKDDLNDALSHIRAALDGSPDTDTSYLAHLVEGRVQTALGHDREATEAFFAASRAIPDADAAAFNLASRLFLEGNRIQADVLVRHVFATTDTVDPWAFFLMPEYRDWELKLQALRDLRR
jgi:hypothetical protein